ncbi:MAG TPA: DNA-binding response regulator, partial [Ruminococcaceae bacterium]|nr:DNA-binding response regulator [Oscillospiraceae bacterium]
MKTILVAEDEQAIREFVVINLKRAGYETLEAANGEEALKICDREGPKVDVAVLDIMMPGKYDGLAVCKELRRRSNSIGIILLTAKTQEMDKVGGLMMGADD